MERSGIFGDFGSQVRRSDHINELRTHAEQFIVTSCQFRLLCLVRNGKLTTKSSIFSVVRMRLLLRSGKMLPFRETFARLRLSNKQRFCSIYFHQQSPFDTPLTIPFQSYYLSHESLQHQRAIMRNFMMFTVTDREA
jgi:hypothetical protein